jgi:phytoene synthase
MGRVYIPESELQAVGLTRDDLLDRNLNEIKSQLQPVLVKLGAQAESYYAAAQELIPLIHPDSRPSLRVLVRIYHRLLQRIQANGYDVFSERIAVPSYQKLFILAQGLLNVLWQKAATSRP